MGPVQRPVGVRSTDDPVPAPRDDEEHRRLSTQNQAGVPGDGRAGHHQVHPLAGAHPQAPARLRARHVAQQGRDVVAPHPGRGDDGTRPYLELGLGRAAAGLHVPYPHPGDLPRVPHQADGAGAGHHRRAETGRGPGQGDHQAGVVDLPVVVPDGAGERLLAQAGEEPARAGAGEVPVQRHAAALAVQQVAEADQAGERVVHGDAGAVVDPLPGTARQVGGPAGERHEERHRADQVRCQPGGEQAALPQRLVHQAELQLLQIAQSAVDQLAGPAGGPGGQVAGLDQGHRQPAGRGVHGRTRAGHPAADHQDVKPLAAQPLQIRRATGRRELAGRVPGDGWITHVRGLAPHRVRGCLSTVTGNSPIAGRMRRAFVRRHT